MEFSDVFFTLLSITGLIAGTYLFAISQSDAAVEIAEKRRDSSRKPRKKKANTKKPSKLNISTPAGMATAMHVRLRELESGIDDTPPIVKLSPRVITLGFSYNTNFSDKDMKNKYFDMACRSIKRVPKECNFVPSLPGKYASWIGVEVPRYNNPKTFEPVGFGKLLNSREFKEAKVPAIIGENTFGDCRVMDLADDSNCHIYACGSTGSGKTTWVDSVIFGLSLLPNKNRPWVCIIDAAKEGEDLEKFDRLPNLYAPLADNNEKARDILVTLSESLGRRRKTDRPIVVVVDEVPALFDSKVNPFADECKSAVNNISAVGRSKRVHLILLTQDASVSVLNSKTKNNIKGRVALMCGPGQTGQILGNGYEVDGSKLFGYGDLYVIINGKLQRCQSPYLSEEKIREWMDNNGRDKTTEYPIETNKEKPKIVVNTNKDDLYKLSRSIVSGYIEDNRCYGKAKLAGITGLSEYDINTNLLPDLEKLGVIGPVKGRKPRNVLIQNHSDLDAMFDRLGD